MNEVFNNYHDQFHDFDDPETYNEYMEKATSRSTSNFVVRFGANKSRIATNLTEQDVDALIHQTAPGKGDQDLPVTWMYAQPPSQLQTFWLTFGTQKSLVGQQ